LSKSNCNLGAAYAAYAALPDADQAENLQKAIAAYEAALRVNTKKDFPVAWAQTQNNLGAAYADLPTRDRAANLKSAKACFKAALRVYTEKGFPIDHRAASAKLADVERQLSSLTSK